MRKLIAGLMVPPKGTNANFFKAMMYVSIASVVFHFCFIFIFWIAGVPPMALFNIASVLILSLAIILETQGKMMLPVFLLALELIAHAIFAVYFTGWGAGFQQYLLALVVYAFMIPRQRLLSTVLVISSIAVYLLLYYYSLANTAAYAHTLLLKYFFVPNTVIALGNAVSSVAYYMQILDNAETSLQEAHQKSESLLNNILPSAIADRLKTTTSTIADSFNSATVLFGDIEGFTPFSENISPPDLVDMLNQIFSQFDALVEKHDLEKIKTIGDSYMVASGIPINRDDHAECMAAFALDMRAAFAEYVSTHQLKLQLRIGMHSGPVVAGVIGKLRFHYDLWGDCVNIASRMESHGIPGEIQVSETTYHILRDKFHFEERGVIDVKGKGKVRTFLLKERL